MNRTQAQNIALARVEDARVLFAAQRWSAAYYVAGYAVECGLKACILAFVERTGSIFIDKKFSEKCWTHDFTQLIRQAGLDTLHEDSLRADAVLAGYWGVVKDWTEHSRYESRTEVQARDLIEAITNDPHGVLKWIQIHW